MDALEHIAPRRLERFRARILPVPELVVVARHLSDCALCRQRFQATSVPRSPALLLAALAPSRATQHEHLTYQQVTAYHDGQLPAAEQTFLTAHLSGCASCRNELDYYTAFRRGLAAEMSTVYAPVPPAKSVWWRYLPARWAERLRAWWPATPRAYAWSWAVLLLMLTGLGGAVWLRHKSQSPIARQPAALGPLVAEATPATKVTPDTTAPPTTPTTEAQPSPTTPPAVAPSRPMHRPREARAPLPPPVLSATAKSPSPARPSRRPPLPATPPVMARPAPSGTGSRPATVPATPEVLALNLTRPAVLQELASVGGAVRSGQNTTETPSALSPSGIVVREPRPTFRWQPVAGALSYQVVIADDRHQSVVQSASLPPDTASWTPSVALPAGRVLTWAVLVQLSEGALVMPSPSQPEAKFQLLSAAQRQELTRQEKEPRPSLAMAVAYARLGLLAAAERELREYLAQHPNDPAAQKLLRQVLAW